MTNLQKKFRRVAKVWAVTGMEMFNATLMCNSIINTKLMKCKNAAGMLARQVAVHGRLKLNDTFDTC